MKYAFYFGILSMLSFWAGWMTPIVLLRVLFLWNGVWLFGIALAYAARCPGLLMKRPNGTIHPLAYALYWPYHGLNMLLLYGVRRLGRARAYDEIVPGLFLGGRLLSRDFPTPFTTAESFAVLDLTSEFTEHPLLRLSPHYRLIPLLDATAPTLEQLQVGVAWIAEHHPDRSVFVHCAMGNSRSATFVAAYLISHGHAATVPEALDLIRSRRPGIGPNRQQQEVLRAFANGTLLPKGETL
jgi:hypothetical protein